MLALQVAELDKERVCLEACREGRAVYGHRRVVYGHLQAVGKRGACWHCELESLRKVIAKGVMVGVVACEALGKRAHQAIDDRLSHVRVGHGAPRVERLVPNLLVDGGHGGLLHDPACRAAQRHPDRRGSGIDILPHGGRACDEQPVPLCGTERLSLRCLLRLQR